MSNAASPLHPRQILATGWYWAFIDERDTPLSSYQTWAKANGVFTSTTQREESSGVIFKTESPLWWVLFEVRQGPVTWTLPGFPSRGAQTDTLDGVMGGGDHRVPAITSPEHPFNKFFGSEDNPIVKAMDAANGALKLLLYGGAAVVLFRLFSGLSGDSVQRAARSASDAVRKRLPKGKNP